MKNISFIVITTNKAKRRIIPTAEAICLNLGLTSRLIIDSIITIKICHPSKPGNGNRLKIARLTLIKPQINKY